MNQNFVKLEYLMNKFAIGKSTVYEYIAKGDIPAGNRISHRMTRWLQSDIDTAFVNFCQKKGFQI